MSLIKKNGHLMKSKILFYLIFTLSINSVFAQKLVEDFVLSNPEQKVASKFSKITVIDSRIDTTNVGIIQKGAFNKKALLKPTESLKKQIEKVFDNLILDKTGNGELLLNIRDFKFAEVTEAFSETGYCYLRADLFSKKDSVYMKIDFIDKVFEVNAMDVTKKNIKNGSQKLIDFITSSLVSDVQGEYYSFDDILKISSLEKRKIPAYNTTNFENGVYMTFDNFKNQKPSIKDIKIIKNKKNQITKILWIRANNSEFEINNNDLFAVIDEGKVYVNNNDKFIPVEFKDDDFYFIGRAKVTAKTGTVVLASAFFGILGGLLASDSSADFIMKIDHLNGAAIQVKLIEK